jgi:hypothetical protein
MADWPWRYQAGAMTTGELAGARDEVSRALEGAPLGDPGRAALESQLRILVKEQETRRRSELTSRGRHYERAL